MWSLSICVRLDVGPLRTPPSSGDKPRCSVTRYRPASIDKWSEPVEAFQCRHLLMLVALRDLPSEFRNRQHGEQTILMGGWMYLRVADAESIIDQSIKGVKRTLLTRLIQRNVTPLGCRMCLENKSAFVVSSAKHEHR
jgi:hypothetical protein